MWFDKWGNLSREDGPAVENANGLQEWFVGGVRHRTEGPAIINANGQEEYWVDGVRRTMSAFYTQKELEEATESFLAAKKRYTEALEAFSEELKR